MAEKHSYIRSVKHYVVTAAVLIVVVLGMVAVAVTTPVLAQTPDSRDPLALYDRNEDGQIDADEFILAFADYLERRIDATLLMRVRQLYLSTVVTGASQEITWHVPVCDKHDKNPKDGVISRDEVVEVINDFLFGDPPTPTRDDVLKVIACYYHTYAHLVSFSETEYSVDEGSNVTITLEMSRPDGTSTIDVPVEVVAGGSAGSGDFSFTAKGANTTSTTTTFAASSTRTSFKVYARQDATNEKDETVKLSLGTFSTSTTPNDVYPDPRSSTTTVTIRDDDTHVPQPPTNPPGTPTDFTATPARTKDAAALNWEQGDGATPSGNSIWHCSYEEDESPCTPSTKLQSVGRTDTDAVVGGLTNGTTTLHVFMVQATLKSFTRNSAQVTMSLRPAPEGFTGTYNSGMHRQVTPHVVSGSQSRRKRRPRWQLSHRTVLC